MAQLMRDWVTFNVRAASCGALPDFKYMYSSAPSPLAAPRSFRTSLLSKNTDSMFIGSLFQIRQLQSL